MKNNLEGRRWIGLLRQGVLASALLLASCSSCGEPEPEPPEERFVQPVDVGFSHTFVTNTSVLRFTLPYDPQFEEKLVNIVFDGELVGGGEFREEFVTLVERDEEDNYFIELAVSGGLWERVGVEREELFTGVIEVEILDLLGAFAVGRLEDVQLEFDAQVEPVIANIEARPLVYPGQLLKLTGRGFLRPEEGVTWAIVERGELVASDGERRDVTGERLPVRWTGGRDGAGLPVLPQVFGISQATFDGSFRFENQLADNKRHEGTAGKAVAVSVDEARITTVTPSRASRSQIVEFRGDGFLPTDDEVGYGMIIRYEGTFTPEAAPDLVLDYRGPRAIERAPLQVVDSATIRQDIWSTVNRDTFELEGLGALTGVFKGRIVPVLLYGPYEEIGRGVNVEFTVEPTLQVVHVRFLPSFSDSLAKFGLGNVEREVRQRIFDVLQRDYRGINIEFVERPPSDFADYMTIEIGGPDPTGMNLLGYDNSFNGVPKDTGNLFLKDYLGGYSRASEDASFSPYGGVFIESFTIFSPMLSDTGYETAPAFDMVMGEVMPGLGGTVVSGTEWPDGPRAEQIQAAIELIGNLAGHTATHEIGHSLGLPFVPGEDPGAVHYHNDDEGEAFIMDSGSSRPFLERAELDGGPARFSPANKAYLREILPMP